MDEEVGKRTIQFTQPTCFIYTDRKKNIKNGLKKSSLKGGVVISILYYSAHSLFVGAHLEKQKPYREELNLVKFSSHTPQ